MMAAITAAAITGLVGLVLTEYLSFLYRSFAVSVLILAAFMFYKGIV